MFSSHKGTVPELCLCGDNAKAYCLNTTAILKNDRWVVVRTDLCVLHKSHYCRMHHYLFLKHFAECDAKVKNKTHQSSSNFIHQIEIGAAAQYVLYYLSCLNVFAPINHKHFSFRLTCYYCCSHCWSSIIISPVKCLSDRNLFILYECNS